MEFQVNKRNLTESRLVEVDFDVDTPLAKGELLLKIDKFGFSANNITYGVIGEQLGYWQFFPPGGEDTQDWGILPVWGFSDVIKSNVEGVEIGERLFGYFPPAGYLKMQNVNASEFRLIDGAEHRSKLPPGYNTYRRVNAEPGYKPEMDNLRMLLWPLHITSFCLWDSLRDRDWFGAKQVIVVSASSKTSLGLGYALSDDDTAPQSIGLTSSRNKSWVEGLGIYDSCVTYDRLDELNPSLPTAIVDMSGNSELLAKLQSRLGDNMKYCINVGLTHWDEAGKDSGIDESKREMFFAPAHIQKRLKDWGMAGFEQKSSAFMYQSSVRSTDWLRIHQLQGAEGLASVYADVCAGKISPEQGLAISM